MVRPTKMCLVHPANSSKRLNSKRLPTVYCYTSCVMPTACPRCRSLSCPSSLYASLPSSLCACLQVPPAFPLPPRSTLSLTPSIVALRFPSLLALRLLPSLRALRYLLLPPSTVHSRPSHYRALPPTTVPSLHSLPLRRTRIHTAQLESRC